MLIKDRFDKVVANMKEMGIPQILVGTEAPVGYLTGREFKPMERCGAILIRDNGEAIAFMNNLFCFEPLEGVDMRYYADGENVYKMIADELKPGKVGFDNKWLSKHTVGVLLERDDIKPCDGSLPIDYAKMIKGADEIEKLKNAGRVNDMAVELGISMIQAGRKEKEIADAIEALFEANGGVQDEQYQLVMYGPNAADPHHGADSVSELKDGDCVLFDLWAPINGYWCDMTRTVFYKHVSDRDREVYEIVKKAQQAALDFIKPGVKMSEIDKVARDIITEAGYGPNFTHRLGHGVGLTVHEFPDASPVCDIVAQPGMCFSVEPGIYLAGEMGVRIEDLVVVTEDGCETLTKYPKDLQIVCAD